MTAKITSDADSRVPLQDSLRERIRFLSIQEVRARQEREILEQTLSVLLSIDSSLLLPTMERKSPFSSSAHLPEGNNKTVIASILQEKGKSLRVMQIAKHAFDNGLIQSAKGLEGVYSIVQTVLSRNSKTTFVKRDRGVWDLRERHSNKESQSQDKEKNQVLASSGENANGVSVPVSQPASAIAGLTPNDAIISTLQKSNRLLAAREIRAALDREAYPKERWGKNGGYFYGVLMRLAKRKKISKKGNKYGALPNEDIQKKTNNLGDDISLQ